MGSIEVYDYKQQKWVPYIDDPEKWYQHFKDLRDGYAKPDHRGRYIVGSGNRNRKFKEMEGKLKETEEKLKETQEKLKETQHSLKEAEQPKVNLVTPVAQATAIAQSEVERMQKRYADSPPRKRIRQFKWDY